MGMQSSTRPVPEDYNPPALHATFSRQRRGGKPELITRDGYPVFEDDPLRDSHVLLDNYLRAALNAPKPDKIKIAGFPTGKAILDTSPATWPGHLRAVVIRLMFRWTHCVTPGETFGTCQMWRYDYNDSVPPLKPLVSALLSGGIDLSDEDFKFFIDVTENGDDFAVRDIRSAFDTDHLIDAAEAILRRRGESETIRECLRRLRERNRDTFGWGNREQQARVHRIDDLLGEAPADRKLVLDRGEPWADAVLDFLAKSEPDKSQPDAAGWELLLHHCADSASSKPTRKWLKDAKKYIDGVGGTAGFARRVAAWLELACNPRTIPLREGQIVHPWESGYDLYTDKNEAILKGLAWSCAASPDAKLVAPLGRLAEWCYDKIRNYGPRSPKVGNACLMALIGLPDQGPRAELSRLKAKVKQPTAKKMIEKAIGVSAAAAGMTPDDLEELAVGGYGLTEVGRGEKKLGAYLADTRVTGTTKVELRFADASGKRRASPPTDLKGADVDALKDLQHNAKDLAKMLPALRDRLERMPMNRRELPMASWRTRFFDHPVVGTLARRLIWEFVPDHKKPHATLAAMWLNGELVDAGDDRLKKLDEEKTLVRLWHPSTWPPGNVLGWRNFLERHRVTQPFKQAHREVYLLTPAERETRDHSNRFARHILRQHQFAALCTQRGWRYKVIGSWDGGVDNTPTLALPKWNLTAELWVDPAGDAASDVGPTGVAAYVVTDQVGFYRAETRGNPINLDDVPPLAFSEVLRDVDLFVGVASVGNDPTQLPATDRVGAYWAGYATAELSESSKTRRAVLERLIPRLKIASRLSLVDRFLVVRGDLRTYKIHLGSANILMEPNDQYLCIVPDRGAAVTAGNTADGVFLPFEGDSTLSVILSKAFLLAEDRTITDPTITRQIVT